MDDDVGDEYDLGLGCLRLKGSVAEGVLLLLLLTVRRQLRRHTRYNPLP